MSITQPTPFVSSRPELPADPAPRAAWPAVAALALLLLLPPAAQAEPLLAFSFDGEAGLDDPIGGFRLRLRQDARITPLPSPAGLGAHFDGGSGALSLRGTDGCLGIVPDVPAIEGSFTVEARINLLGLPPRIGHMIAMVGELASPRKYAWMLLVRADGNLGTAPRELALVLSDGERFEHVNSGLIIEPGVDYYLAAAADIEGGTVTFHRRRLDGSHAPERVVRAHTLKRLNPATLLQVGDSLNNVNAAFGGLIDELRISRGALAAEALAWPSGVGPE
jgi:hypothetical protein